MPHHDPGVRLMHMRDFARKAIELAKGKTRLDLEKDEVLRLALTHLVELVGEAASKLNEEERNVYPQIPWPKLISMRNRGYDYIDYDILWNAIAKNLPERLEQLDQVLIGGLISLRRRWRSRPTQAHRFTKNGRGDGGECPVFDGTDGTDGRRGKAGDQLSSDDRGETGCGSASIRRCGCMPRRISSITAALDTESRGGSMFRLRIRRGG
jgi:uncharacterized protein with HEPN domain